MSKAKRIMLLQTLRLKNIRSYIDETIKFPEGSSLLAGDIGSGKSSILLAIEFALFGASRPDLPAESLLRKGTTHASVELTFLLEHETSMQSITICRNLRKEQDTIKQMPGHFICNGIKKELMPVELKAEMISILGYPPEMISKNKNYIFRYTVYTPQDEMKFILHEDPEIRLDTLRKIFNVDKYKIIRENTQHCLRQLRLSIRQLETSTEPLELRQNELTNTRKNKEEAQHLLKQLEQHIVTFASTLHKEQQEMERLEQEQRRFIEAMQQQQLITVIIREKEQVRQHRIKQEELVQNDLEALSHLVQETKEKIEQEKKEIEKQLSQEISKEASLKEQFQSLQRAIVELRQEIQLIEPQVLFLGEKERQVQELALPDGEIEKLEKEKNSLQEKMVVVLDTISRQETLLTQAKGVQQRIADLDICPTCAQVVLEGHKQAIHVQEQEKIGLAEKILAGQMRLRDDLLQQQQGCGQQIRMALARERELTKAKQELLALLEKKRILDEKQGKIKEKEINRQQCLDESNRMIAENRLQQLRAKMIEYQQRLEMSNRRSYLEQQLQQLTKEKEAARMQLEQLHHEAENISALLGSLKDLTLEIQRKKAAMKDLQEQEKRLLVQKAQTDASLQFLQKKEDALLEEVTKLEEQKGKLTNFKEIAFWLEETFLNLTYTIEKHVMVHIHHLFNQLFQEWFSILIQEETMSARLDDSFTPIIEQNGYEIPFILLSGGEKTSAALSYRLALNKVINDVIDNIKTKDLLILDEPTDGFSSEQLDKVREVLDRLPLRQTILVSHEAKIETFVNSVIKIEKEGHQSKVMV